jgi:hypothetical protein
MKKIWLIAVTALMSAMIYPSIISGQEKEGFYRDSREEVIGIIKMDAPAWYIIWFDSSGEPVFEDIARVSDSTDHFLEYHIQGYPYYIDVVDSDYEKIRDSRTGYTYIFYQSLD